MGRLNLRRPIRRIQRGQKAQHKARAADQRHIAALQL